MATVCEGSIRIPPPEIITEILYRLPAKSLGRFRCVSKGWLSLISDPQFIRTHQKTLNQNHIIFRSSSDVGLLYSQPFDNHIAELTPAEFHSKLNLVYYVTVCDSCDGLVLVKGCFRTWYEELMILNPTTRESVNLSESDPCLELGVPIALGFGYDSLGDDYKVVNVRCLRYSDYTLSSVPYVHVYSLKTNSWKQVVDLPYNYNLGRIKGAFVNGFIHWAANHPHAIVAFSLANECFSEVPLPELCNVVDIMSKNDFTLFVLGGKLAIFGSGVVWLMNEYGVKESWTKILIHGFNDISMRCPTIFDNNGKILFAECYRMLEYDIEERSFSKEVWTPKEFKVVGTCVESLVSLKTN